MGILFLDEHTLIHSTMSLIPSSIQVESKLSQLREARVASLAAFRAAVEEARIGWEAELILALEEFRDTRGFDEIQERIRAKIPRLRGPEIAWAVGGGQTPRMSGHPSFSEFSNSSRLHQIKEDRWREIYYPDVLDIKQALQQSRPDTNPPDIKGEPTMISERANFRYNYLKDVYDNLDLAYRAEAEQQQARDLEFLRSRRGLQEEEAAARRRLSGRL